MSRLESHSEPSMEEILASIRKIIAEDSSGSRTSSTPSRPGSLFAPAAKSVAPQPAPAAPAPQRGFMSREAFLKSSQSPETEPSRETTYTPLGPSRPTPGEATSAASSARLQPRDESPVFAKPSPTLRERDAAPAGEPLGARDVFRPIEPSQPTTARESSNRQKSDTPDASRSSVARNGAASNDVKKSDASSVETVEFVSIEDALPIIKNDTPSVLKSEPAPQGAKPDTTSIEAQLSELLSEDLNALRQGRAQEWAKAQADEIAAKAGEPKDQPEGAVTDSESADPFAFDLGPSPFAVKPEPEREPSAAPESSAATRVPPAPQTPAAAAVETRTAATPDKAQPQRSTEATEPKAEIKPEPEVKLEPNAAFAPVAEPSQSRPDAAQSAFVEKPAPLNGPYFGPFVPNGFGPPQSATPTATSVPTPSSNASPPKFEPGTPAAKPRQTFAVPSVSATLGPSRKLEPLSNAFRPSPPPQPDTLETFSPAPEVGPEPPWAVEPFRQPEPRQRDVASEPPVSDNQRADAIMRSTLPATTLDSSSSLDRPMEDAVADLLRPLLKTWLAENMPKIVERALRREMTERLLPGQKNPRD